MARVFFIFRLTNPPDPSFLKIEKKIKEIFFNFIFVFPSDSCQYSSGVHFVFSTAARLIKLPSVTAPVRYCHFNW